MSVNTICATCALDHGGELPRIFRAATFFVGPCDNCGVIVPVCDVRDWDWPHGRPAGWEGNGCD